MPCSLQCVQSAAQGELLHAVSTQVLDTPPVLEQVSCCTSVICVPGGSCKSPCMWISRPSPAPQAQVDTWPTEWVCLARALGKPSTGTLGWKTKSFGSILRVRSVGTFLALLTDLHCGFSASTFSNLNITWSATLDECDKWLLSLIIVPFVAFKAEGRGRGFFVFPFFFFPFFFLLVA